NLPEIDINSTLHTWHQDISELYIATQISQIVQASSFSIMINESTHVVHINNLFKYNSETVSNAIIKSIQKEGLDVMKCKLWTTDNTAYMSLNKNGAVALFNKKTGANTFQVATSSIVVTQDPIPRIMQDGKLVQLPNNNIEMFFADELLEAIDVLS
ncbi:27045_t:CDS:2, partial [Gigaspora margarita]